MKSSRAAGIVLALLYGCFLGYWAWSGSQLPERVATHFGVGGEPDGWMTRSASQKSALVFGFAFPLFVVVLCYAARFLPERLINLPRKDYWLAPERRSETFNYLVGHSLWFACLAVCFVIWVQYSIVQANQRTPPHLVSAQDLSAAGLFMVGTAIWVLALVRHFHRPRLLASFCR